MAIPIVILKGDQTGQELLDEALRVLAPDVTGLAVQDAYGSEEWREGYRRR